MKTLQIYTFSLLFLLACGEGRSVISANGSGDSLVRADNRESAKSFVSKLNQMRVNQGLTPLKTCAKLDQAAQNHAKDMFEKSYFSHEDLSQGQCWDRACKVGFEPACNHSASFAENIALGPLSSDQAFDLWNESPGHHANMFNSAYTLIGVGIAGNQSLYWVTVFSDASLSECGTE